MEISEVEHLMKTYSDYSLLSHNTFGIEARCARFVEFDTAEEAAAGLPALRQTGLPMLLLGGGSNLLLTGDFPGIVVHSAIKGVTRLSDREKTTDEVIVRAGSGEVWDDFVDRMVTDGWYGAENLSLIPGEIGASAVQNIGAYGAEVKDLIVEVEAVETATGRQVRIPAEECAYGYRQSRFKREWKDRYFITSVTYRLSTVFTPRLDYGNIRAALERKGITSPTARDVRDVIIETRRYKLPDPQVTGNAGSFFVNPVVSREQFLALQRQYPDMPHYAADADRVKIPAGWLIEQCGWKGRSLGKAAVHDRQALVLVNRGGAKGADIVALCEAIRKDVQDKFGILLHPEVNKV